MVEEFLYSLLRERGPFYLMDLLRDLSREENTYRLASLYGLSKVEITLLRSDGFQCLRFILEEMSFVSLRQKKRA